MSTVATATEKKAHMGTDEKPERKLQRARVDDKFKIFCGTANEALSDEVCAFLGLTRGQAHITRFKDGECYVQIQENVRGADVFVMQPTCRPVDEHLMELLLMMDALKRASARRITAVIPYYGYARQDRKDKPRVPISSKLVADLLTTAGARSGVGGRSACAAVAGIFQYSGGPLVRFAGAGQLFPGLESAGPDGGFAGRGWRGARAILREEDGCGAGHRRQTARRNERGGSDARDRRRTRTELSDHRRFD